MSTLITYVMTALNSLLEVFDDMRISGYLNLLTALFITLVLTAIFDVVRRLAK